MENWLNQMNEWLTLYGLKVLVALILFIVGRLVIGLISSTIRRQMKRSKMDETLSKFVISIARAILMVILVIVVLDQLGIETTSLVAILGAAGLAIGFALQSSLGNFASGVMLIIFRPFRAGDYVEVVGTAGVINEVGIFRP